MASIINFIKKLLRRSRVKSTKNSLPKEFVIDSNCIIQRKNHNISKTDISSNALKVLNRLTSSGFQAYLVGGSVRDLLLGKAPKDFDVATNATPNQIRALFRNARIIGKRFKLAHIIFYREIIEVATFRSSDSENSTIDRHQTNEKGMLVRDNVYGTLDEDALRRDFTANSLYYDIDSSCIIDFTGGFKDIKQAIIRIIGEPISRYQEDPVRMLRAIRFSAKLNFDLDLETAQAITQQNTLIKNVSSARLFDEVTKLYQCGAALQVQELLNKYNLFSYLFAQTAALLKTDKKISDLIRDALESTDLRMHEGKPVNPAFIFAVFLWFPLKNSMKIMQEENALAPLEALEKAMTQIIIEQNKVIMIPRRFTQVMREMWVLQFRFPKRLGNRALNLLQHPRFRAAYDLLVLRARANDESPVLAKWWTDFQDTDAEGKKAMIAVITPKRRKKATKVITSDDK